MPKRKARYDHVKLYRPRGMRYAHGSTDATVFGALLSAARAWHREFGAAPKQECIFYEIMGVTGGWSATIMEIKDNG